ncbi:murein hydrolase activator EnvC family protein [Streptomyces tsukubensis]|uniref:M23ase beta-sheet core domain-containing protein n=1 Tax=Streptomyces tsukubensis TaxID=83656 RepID=A0A1V4A5L3_9ACTN|nr:hypothetical protein B1H18_20945 [Streptomyces tsukubensis]
MLQDWDPPASTYGPGHRGVDLGAAIGSVVRAAAGGRVAFAGQVGGRGVVTIELRGTGSPPLRTTYEPVAPTVKKGDVVRAGQQVGVVGSGPFHCAAPCLHWGLLRGELYLDPLSLLPRSMLYGGAIRLLPVTGVPYLGGPSPGTGLLLTSVPLAERADSTEVTAAVSGEEHCSAFLLTMAGTAHGAFLRRGSTPARRRAGFRAPRRERTTPGTATRARGAPTARGKQPNHVDLVKGAPPEIGRVLDSHRAPPSTDRTPSTGAPS